MKLIIIVYKIQNLDLRFDTGQSAHLAGLPRGENPKWYNHSYIATINHDYKNYWLSIHPNLLILYNNIPVFNTVALG